MHHFSLFFLFFYFQFFTIQAQINYGENSVQVKPIWKVGETYQYKFIDTDYVISVNDTVSKIVSKSTKNINVLDENQFVYKLLWENKEVKTNDPDEFYNDYLTNSENLKYEYATNKEGEFLELLNEDEVKNQMLSVAKKLKKKNPEIKKYVKMIRS